MFKKKVLAHKELNTDARAALVANPESILVTIDIAQYFENIGIERLRANLVELLGPDCDQTMQRVIDVLVDCLISWCPYSRRGIPQNMNPSSHLGNVFLNSLDRGMVGAGWNYWRYMDDIKIAAPDEARARVALKTVIGHLRELELSVNSEKTSLIRPRSPKYVDFVREEDGEVEAIEAAVERKDPVELQIVGQRLYEIAEEHLNDGTTSHRRFRFVLGRLTSYVAHQVSRSMNRAEFGRRVIDLLKTQPTDTPAVRAYLAARTGDGATARALASLLIEEPVCVYEWQNYHLWVQAALDEVEDAGLLEKARRVLDAGVPGPEMAGRRSTLAALASPLTENWSGVACCRASAREPLNVRYVLRFSDLTRQNECHCSRRLVEGAGSIAVLAKIPHSFAATAVCRATATGYTSRLG